MRKLEASREFLAPHARKGMADTAIESATDHRHHEDHMTNVPDPVLNAAEVALDLRCSKAHVHHLINGAVAGVPALPALRLGRRAVVLRSSLERWKAQVESRAAGGTLVGSLNVDAVGASRSKN